MMTGCVLECVSTCRYITWYLTSDDRWSCIQGVLPGTAPICLQEEEKKSIVHHLSCHDVSARRFNSPLSRILIESILPSSSDPHLLPTDLLSSRRSLPSGTTSAG